MAEESQWMELEVPEFASEEKCKCPEPMFRQAANDPPVICNPDVPFCVTTTVPKNFPLTTLLADRLVFDPGCLACVVTPTVTTISILGCVSSLTLFAVEVKGCIPFIASAEFMAPTTICGGTAPTLGDGVFDISQQGSVCVDNIICFKQLQSDALSVCSGINLSCTGITATYDVITLPCEPILGCTCVVPTCPAPCPTAPDTCSTLTCVPVYSCLTTAGTFSGATNLTFCGRFTLPTSIDCAPSVPG